VTILHFSSTPSSMASADGAASLRISLIKLSTREPEILTKVGLHFARLETAFASALARSQAAGELPPGVGPERAPYLVCFVQGLNVVARTKPTRTRLKAMIEVALECFAKGIKNAQ
jgi:TetR/AcrR family transcriptional repressor of nem operon